MKKINSGFKILLVILIACIIILLSEKSVFANPVGGFQIKPSPGSYILSFLITIALEYLMFDLIVDIRIKNSKIALFFTLTFANLITFPLTQLCLNYFLIPQLGINTIISPSPKDFPIIFVFLLGILILELIAISIEYLLISLTFDHYSNQDKKYLRNKNRNILFGIIVANILSFVLGTMNAGVSEPFVMFYIGIS
jgi:hypothetical protein